MSASSKKKLRKEQKAAAMTERQKAAKKEEKKLKIYTATFWIVLALCVCLVLGMVLKNPIDAMIRQNTNAVTVGDHKVSAVELNYFYIDAINEFRNQYSSYLSAFLDTSKPLNEQKYYMDTTKTWDEAFLDMALDNAKNTYALYDAAKAANYSLTEEERKSMDELYDSMDDYAEYYGYDNADKYLEAIYGRGANEKTYCDYYEVTVLASSYYAAYAEDLKDSYKPADLRDFEKDKLHEYNSYTYLSHYMSVDTFKMGGTKGEDGKTTYSEEEIKAAEQAVKEAAEKLAKPENNTAETLNAAIKLLEQELEAAKKEAAGNKTEDKKEETSTDKTEDKKEETTTDKTEDKKEETSTEPTNATESAPESRTPETTEPTDATDSTDKGEADSEDKKDEDKEESEGADKDKEDTKKYSTCTENDDVLYTSVNTTLQEWLRDEARKEGDITYIAYETTTTDADGKEVKTLKGYYVVVFQACNDNNYALKDVRHLLVSFEGGTKDSSGNTTYSDAEKKTAKEKAEKLLKEWEEGERTEDSFAELVKKNSTDTGSKDNGGLYEDIYPGQMVKEFEEWCFAEGRKTGDTGIVETTYGYHIMFFSADSEILYRDYMVKNDLLEHEVNEWQDALIKAMTLTEENTSYVKRDLLINQNS